MKQESALSRSSHYLRNRILLLTLSFTALVSLLIIAVSAYLYRNHLQKALLQNAEVNMQLLVDTIDKRMEDVMRFAGFCQSNTTISRFTEEGSSYANTAYERLTEEYRANEAYPYLHRVIVSGREHQYLQLVSAVYSSSRNMALEAEKLPFFDELLQYPSYDFSIGFLKDPLYSGRYAKTVLPLVRPIYARYNAASTGWVMIFITEDLFTNILTYYNLSEDSFLLLTLGEHIYRLSSQGIFEITRSVEDITPREFRFLNDDTSASEIKMQSDDTRLIVTRPFRSLTGCTISQVISPKELNAQKTLFILSVLAVLVLFLLLGFVLFYLLYRMISVPVLQLRKQIQQISTGDFSENPAIEWNHELGDIGKGINRMASDIGELLHNRLEDEKKRQDLEYRMLQSQINPHFLYNTLNSIKWMASIQGADGIAEMTTALSRLLKSVSKGTSTLIPRRDELNLLQDYFTIQQYRYGGTLKMHISVEDDSLYECSIVKFTLQPLVENSIFHGIEPKKNAGTIKIDIRRTPDDCIRITVEDDGIGMTQETARRLLEEPEEHPSDFFRHLGVSSVHKRLQYEFGPEYGIAIDTLQNQYTRMILTIPARQ